MRKVAVLAVGLLAALSVTTGTAVGGSGSGLATTVAGCALPESEGAEVFDGLRSLLVSGATARGIGSLAGREPTLNEKVESLPASAKGKGAKFAGATVPVWFHVISDGTAGKVNSETIDSQLAVLKLGFDGFYGGAKSGFTFTLAGVTRTTNPTWYNARAGGDAERDMKRALHKGGFETLNVYTNLAGGYLGYAYLPGLPDSRLYLDGIVLNWESMPGASTAFAGTYDLGLTLVHEAGHWVNLEHTFAGACNAKGDYVADTPAMSVPTNGCPAGKDTCREPGVDPIHNFMDYSYDSCYEEFTADQVARARDSWVYFRAP